MAYSYQFCLRVANLSLSGKRSKSCSANRLIYTGDNAYLKKLEAFERQKDGGKREIINFRIG